MKTRKRDDGKLDVIDDAGTVVAIVDEKVLKHLAESNTLARAMFERGHSIGSRMVNVSLEQCEARRGKPVPGPTGWLWCSHCGGHMVPPGQPNARCKKCK